MFDGLTASVVNYLKLAARISPFFLVFFLVLVSLFDSQWGIKGFVYLACVLILALVNFLIAIVMDASDQNLNKHPLCRVFDFPMGDTHSYSPALNSAIIAYTLVYLLYPMVVNDTYNYGVIGMVTVLYLTDTFMSLSHDCTDTLGIILGTAIGAVLSFGVVFTILASGNESLLFFNELKSNNVVCKRPANQNFRCRVYKNGELISGFTN